MPRCNDYDEVCQAEADPEYMMDFTDVEPGAYIHWCAACGKRARVMNDALQNAFETRPGFAAKLETEINKRQN